MGNQESVACVSVGKSDKGGGVKRSFARKFKKKTLKLSVPSGSNPVKGSPETKKVPVATPTASHIQEIVDNSSVNGNEDDSSVIIVPKGHYLQYSGSAISPPHAPRQLSTSDERSHESHQRDRPGSPVSHSMQSISTVDFASVSTSTPIPMPGSVFPPGPTTTSAVSVHSATSATNVCGLIAGGSGFYSPVQTPIVPIRMGSVTGPSCISAFNSPVPVPESMPLDLELPGPALGGGPMEPSKRKYIRIPKVLEDVIVKEHAYVGIIQDKFELIKKLGGGVSGTVYKMKDRETGEYCALKAIKRKNKGDVHTKDTKNVDEIDNAPMLLFLFEFKFLSKLKALKEHVIALESAYMDEEFYYIRTELASEDLFKRLQKHKPSHRKRLSGLMMEDLFVANPGMTEKNVAIVMSHLLKGLAILHANNIVHRDIKPENIVFVHGSDRLGLVNDPAQLVPKLIDFADSMVVEDDLTYAELVGTSFYLAPERWEEHYGWELKASDVFALGISCYEMLTLKRCFHGKGIEQIRSNILRGRWTFPKTHRDLVSNECKDFLAKALAHSSEDRWTAGALLKHPWIRQYTRRSGSKKGRTRKETPVRP